MKYFILILIIFLSFNCLSQTMIEMSSPEDATLILIEVEDSIMGDIYIFKTQKLLDAKEWDCMWKFKKFGFSNFAVYIAKNETELYMTSEDTEDGVEKTFISHGNVYFVKNKQNRGYRKEFALEGMMKVTTSKKMKIRKNDLD